MSMFLFVVTHTYGVNFHILHEVFTEISQNLEGQTDYAGWKYAKYPSVKYIINKLVYKRVTSTCNIY